MFEIVGKDLEPNGFNIKPTARETEILNLLAHGYTAKEVGQMLKISFRTVQKHVDYISKKMRARNRTHLIGMAVSFGWIGYVEPAPVAEFMSAMAD